MKVLNFIWGYGPGGVDKCFLAYAKCHARVSGLQVRSVCIFIEKEGVDLTELDQLGIKVFNAKSKYDLSWARDFNDYVDAEKFDLAFMHASHNTAVFLMARMAGFHRWIPIVRSRHGEFLGYSQKRTIKVFFLFLLEKFILSVVARGIVTVSIATRDNMIRYGIPARKIAVVYNGVPDLRGSGIAPSVLSGTARRAVKFIAVARLVKLKGVDVLMDGFAEAIKDNLGMHLVIVGDGPEYESLKARSKVRQLDSHVTFAGNQNNVSDWLDASDVYCLTSYSEAFPIGLLEAMRAGLPCIVSRVGGNPESVTDEEAVMVAPGNVEEVAAAIRRLAADSELRIKMGQSARRRYEKCFTEDKMCEGISKWLMSFA